MQYTNFFETVKEAEMRLRHTVILYDGVPYYVICVTDHKKDGIFRIYMEPTGSEKGLEIQTGQVPYESHPDHRGDQMDKYLDMTPNTRVIRKMMNSPLFNKFRPFPLGMANAEGEVFYSERSPTRNVEQGLTTRMLVTKKLNLSGSANVYPGTISPHSEFMRDCIVGNYPTAQECIEALTDPDVKNNGVAFHREFAFLRGPMDLIFLFHKNDAVGMLPTGDLSVVKLSKDFRYLKEVIEGLNTFQYVTV